MVPKEENLNSIAHHTEDWNLKFIAYNVKGREFEINSL
jgi:hypothetical protein